jgi:hypothetical protein
MDDVTRGLRQVDQDDINPRFNWGRHLPALGMMVTIHITKRSLAASQPARADW